MIYDYYYGAPMMNYVNSPKVILIAAIIAAVLGVVLFCTFFSKKNEGKFTGFKGKIYNAMNFNKFYAEDILRFLYIVITTVITVMGIVLIVLGSFIAGIIVLVVGNIALRIAYELLMMFIILCRKTVAIDRKLDRIADFYDDSSDDWDDCCCCEDECDDCCCDSDECDECMDGCIREGEDISSENDKDDIKF